MVLLKVKSNSANSFIVFARLLEDILPQTISKFCCNIFCVISVLLAFVCFVYIVYIYCRKRASKNLHALFGRSR